MTQLAHGTNDSGSDGRTERTGLDCRIEHDLGVLEPMRQKWDALVAQAGGDIYFTYDWCRTWWRHYGQERQLRVLLFYHTDQLVGLLPLVIDRLWLGLVPIRLAKLLGSDSTTVVLNPPVMPEHAQTIYAKALSFILEHEHCDALWLGPLAGDKPHRRLIRDACQDSSQFARLLQDQDMTVHTIFRLPGSYDDYLARLEKDHRAMVRRERRIFEKQCRPTIQVIDDPQRIVPAFEEFLRLHQAQWTAQHMLGHFGDMPKAEAFNRDLIATMARRGRAMLLRAVVDGRPVAIEYAFTFAGGLYWRLPARLVGQEWERLSMGRVSLAYLVESAISRGIQWIEGGAGEYPYKRRMGATEFPVGSMLIASSRPASTFKAQLFVRLSHVLHLLYYRIWFSRLAPKLPLRRRPLWKLWIRSRI